MLTHRSNFRSGFTLIELLLVLFIMAVIIGFTAPNASSFLKHQDIRDASGMIQSLAKTARREAVLKHKDHYIVFKTDRFALYAADDPDTPIMELYPDSELAIQIKLWPDDQWVSPNDTKWWFSASGFLFPLSLKIEDKESSWQTLTFDPLSASVLEDSYQFL